MCRWLVRPDRHGHPRLPALLGRVLLLAHIHVEPGRQDHPGRHRRIHRQEYGGLWYDFDRRRHRVDPAPSDSHFLPEVHRDGNDRRRKQGVNESIDVISLVFILGSSQCLFLASCSGGRTGGIAGPIASSPSFSWSFPSRRWTGFSIGPASTAARPSSSAWSPPFASSWGPSSSSTSRPS